jgi:C4-dicarboxylate-specific signal transduction histidine kinase
VREFNPTPPLTVDKHKVLQILVNLIRNAKYAMDERPAAQKVLTLEVNSTAENTLVIKVRDTGAGIAAENLPRVFEHGFTTKRDGHGLGLHSGLIAAAEMGGKLTAQSEGAGKGATFCLELPFQTKTINYEHARGATSH